MAYRSPHLLKSRLLIVIKGSLNGNGFLLNKCVRLDANNVSVETIRDSKDKFYHPLEEFQMKRMFKIYYINSSVYNAKKEFSTFLFLKEFFLISYWINRKSMLRFHFSRDSQSSYIRHTFAFGKTIHIFQRFFLVTGWKKLIGSWKSGREAKRVMSVYILYHKIWKRKLPTSDLN